MNEVQIVEIPCGQGSLNYSQAISDYPKEDLRYCDNLTFEDDTWKKEGGATKINTTVLTDAPTVVGLHDFWVDSSTQKRIAATSDGKIVNFVTGGIDDTLETGLGSNKFTVFVEGLGGSSTRKLFAFNGNDVVQVTSNGESCDDIDTPAADWSSTNQPTAGVMHNGRLWAWGNANDLHRIYYPLLTDHEDYTGTGSGSLSIYPGEGEKIVAAFSFAGRLYVWKFPRGIYWIDDSSTTLANWSATRLTSSVGMAGPLGRAQIDNDVVFVSSEGLIHSLATVQEFGDAKASAIFPEKIGGFVRENINVGRLNRAIAVYYPLKREWHLACASSVATVNDQRLVLDLHDIKNPRYRFSSRDTIEAMALTRDSNDVDKLMVGDDAGFVRLLDQSNRNKDGVAYTGRFKTAEIELFPKGTKRANIQFIEPIFRPQGVHDLTLDIYMDGKLTQTATVGMGIASGGVLGSFTLGADTLGGGNILNTRARVVGDCRRIQIDAYNSGLNEDFSVSSILVGFTIGNERVTI